jgi:transcriptional regulator of nitric oxide reductase
MGNLKPGATYIYERNGDEVYAREFGEKDRTLIGYTYEMQNKPDPRTNDGRPLHEHIMEDKMWGEIRREAQTNITLQKALDRAIMIYRLSKDKPL